MSEGKLVFISDHPDFQSKLNTYLKKLPPLDPNSPSYEQDLNRRYEAAEDGWRSEGPTNAELMDLESQMPSLDLDSADLLGQLEERPVPKVPGLGLSSCQECKFKQDTRSWWKRTFYPYNTCAPDLLCEAAPRKVFLDPVTGRPRYLPYVGRASSPRVAKDLAHPASREEAFARCASMNPTGTCPLFSPKITYA